LANVLFVMCGRVLAWSVWWQHFSSRASGWHLSEASRCHLYSF